MEIKPMSRRVTQIDNALEIDLDEILFDLFKDKNGKS
jgi:hypothetical protein